MEEELQYYQEFLEEFLLAIRISNEADVQHIIDIVRLGSPTGEIRNLVIHLLTKNHLLQPAT
ncbi:hypothetical protein HAV15_012220 [Penicillium sp. str. |nr:hypothetical protein HAV15_012220 [Penicillium sp. str. \